MPFRLFSKGLNIIREFSKGNSVINCRQLSTTQVLNAEPPRKKRRIDPTILRVRVERKIRKHEKEINRLEKEPRQLIPILEYQYNNSTKRDLNSRPTRTIEEQGIDEGTVKAAARLWNFYRLEQSKLEQKSVRRVERAQTRALETLRQLDEALYNRTVSVDDFTLIPYMSSHVRKETPSNASYTPPDGYIKSIVKEWVM